MALDDLKPLIEEGNKTIAALRSEVESRKAADVVTEQKLARMETDLAATLKAKQDHELREKAMEARLAEMEAKANRPGGLASQVITDEHKAAFNDYLRKGSDYNVQNALREAEKKAVDVRIATPASGGFGLPKVIADAVYKTAQDISPIRQIARVITTGTTDYHQVVNTGGLVGEWVGEVSTRTIPTATPNFADVVPTFGEMSATPEATRHSISDLFFNVEDLLIMDGGERFAIMEGAAFISGDGTNKPTGFLTGTPVNTADAGRAFGVLQYLATGQAAALATNAFDTFRTMEMTLKSAYRANARYVMNSLTMAALAIVKDSTGQYLLQQAVSAGLPDTIGGKAITIAEDMPVIAANAFPVAFGDFSKGYLVADIPGTYVIRDEVTKAGWVRFQMFRRVGGRLLDTNAIKLLKVAVS
jgi:HK97 family phage major capsid protein